MAELAAAVAWDADSHVWDDLVDQPTKQIYAAYRRDLGIRGRAAVLAIDLYNKVFEGGPRPPLELQDEYPASCGVYAHSAVQPIVDVLATARELGLPVIHVRVPLGAPIVATNRRTKAGVDEDKRRLQMEFFGPVAPVAGETVVEKERASAFYGTPLVARLVSQGIQTLVVVGESTSGCVRASVVDAYSNGFHTVVVEDAVFDRSWLTHQVNLFDLHHKYADVLPSSTVVPLMRQAASALP
jgi:maleamate amidohydrolase